MCEFLGKNETVTAERYIKTLANLKECIWKKRPHLWADRSFIIHHDNALPHTCGDTKKKMDKWGMQTLEHPAYSPDLAPCALFPKVKSHLRGRHLWTVKQLQDAARETLLAIPTDFYDNAMHDMVTRWQKCVQVNGDYFEGDNVKVDPLFVRVSEASSSEDESD